MAYRSNIDDHSSILDHPLHYYWTESIQWVSSLGMLFSLLWNGITIKMSRVSSCEDLNFPSMDLLIKLLIEKTSLGYKKCKEMVQYSGSHSDEAVGRYLQS